MDIISPGDRLNDYYLPLFIGMGAITGYTICNRLGKFNI